MRVRSVLYAFVLVGLLTLAACQGEVPATTTPTPTPEATDPASANTETDDGEAGDPLGQQAFAPTDAVIASLNLELPPPGTFVVLMPDPSPDAPEVSLNTFERVVFTRTGGLSGALLFIEVLGDGTVTRDGAVSRVDLQVVDQIMDQLNAMNFYNLQGVFTGPASSADSFRYSLTVDSERGSYTISTDDALTPPPLQALYALLLGLGVE